MLTDTKTGRARMKYSKPTSDAMIASVACAYLRKQPRRLSQEDPIVEQKSPDHRRSAKMSTTATTALKATHNRAVESSSQEINNSHERRDVKTVLDTKPAHWDVLLKLQAADLILSKLEHLPLPEGEVCLMEDVNQQWLSKVLGKDVEGAELVSANSVGGHEGMTSRHKWQLEWNDKGKAANLPTRIFFKATPQSPPLREMLALLHMDERECCFYNSVGKELEDLAPKCYYAKSYGGGRHIIILEDLDVRGAVGHWMGDSISVAYAREVAIAFAKIHARFWNSPRFDSDMVWARPHCRRFGEPWQLDFFQRVHRLFLATDDGKNASEYVRQVIHEWDANCVKIWEYFDRKPATLLHGDSHLGNVLEFSDGSAGWYDLQCTFKGYGYRDLAYFTNSALTNEDRVPNERAIFDLYTDTLEQNGVVIGNREEAWLDYCLLKLDRFDSTMTSLTTGGYGHARHALERQLRTISAAIEEHDVLTLMRRVLATGQILPEASSTK